VAAPDLFPGERGPGPPRPVGAVRPAEVWPPHVAAPDLPGESGSAGAIREHPCPHGHSGGGLETMNPAVRPGPYATSPRGRGGGYR
jgi:hypothetical protein